MSKPAARYPRAVIPRHIWEDWRAKGDHAGFDEIALGGWLHVERMDVSEWDVHVDGLHLSVSRGQGGRVRVVLIEDLCNDGKGMLRSWGR